MWIYLSSCITYTKLIYYFIHYTCTCISIHHILWVLRLWFQLMYVDISLTLFKLSPWCWPKNYAFAKNFCYEIYLIYLIGSSQFQQIGSFTCHMHMQLSPLVLQPGSWCPCVTRVSWVSAGQSREIQQSDKEQDKVCSSWQQRFTQKNLEGSRRPCQNWGESQSPQLAHGLPNL